MTTTPDLTLLNFSDIKTSLTDYLKNQSVFSGYNFEGSTIQTLIDLLSYNTYYYAFYSNMMSSEVFLDSAQSINSIISLVKPLGYTVPGLKSATSSITVDVSAPAYTKFNGVFGNGVYYSFYNKEPLVANIVGTITEGTLTLKSDISNSINLTNQTYMLDETDVDISTIRIYVTTSGTETEWTNVNRFPNNNEMVFYIERDGDIFTIQFGKENTLGKSILQTDTVTITYLTSSGMSANGINSFSSSVGNITSKTTSAGGNDGPDINSIKFAAPKIFSSQDRAVTKNDYYGLLTENSMFKTANDFIVYGGDELYPPKYGRVFVSYDNTITDAPTVTNIVSFLKNKNTLTIIPEYTIPKKIDIDITIQIVWKSNATSTDKTTTMANIKTLFSTEYQYGTPTVYKFNNKFSYAEFRESVMNTYSNFISNFIFLNTTFTTQINKLSNINEFSLENDLNINFGFPAVPQDIISDNGTTISIAANASGISTLKTSSTSDVDTGIVDMDTGYFRINSIYPSPSVFVVVKTENSFISAIKYSLSKFNLVLQ
jgi:hypothetical protein